MEFVVSIPQAVSTIAILFERPDAAPTIRLGFNTASGKYYCNSSSGFYSVMVISFQYRKR